MLEAVQTPDRASADHLEALRVGIRESAAAIARKHPRSYWVERARTGRHVPEMWASLVEAGLIGVGVPEQLGGTGGGLHETALVVNELARAGVPSVQLVLAGLAHAALVRHARPEQVEAYLKPSLQGRIRLCLGVTEPDAGTNTFAIKTSARTDGEGWLISGCKTFISAADESDFMYTVVRAAELSEPGGRAALSIFMVPLHGAGVELQKLDVEILMPEHQFTVFLDDVRVGREALVGEPGQGVAALFSALNAERLLIGALGVGLGEYALAKAADYARVRAPFGRPIGAYQGLQHRLARARAHLEAARTLAFSAAAAHDRGEEVSPACAMAKLVAAEAAISACDAAIQVHGGYAFDAGYDVTSLWMLARLFSIAPINDEMLLNYIGEKVLGLPRSY